MQSLPFAELASPAVPSPASLRDLSCVPALSAWLRLLGIRGLCPKSEVVPGEQVSHYFFADCN